MSVMDGRKDGFVDLDDGLVSLPKAVGMCDETRYVWPDALVLAGVWRSGDFRY